MSGSSAKGQIATRGPDEISEEEKNTFKFIKMVYSIARSVLYTIFIWGTLQAAGQTVEDFLLKSKGYSKNKYKRYFDNSQIKKMSDKSLESSFDVTHLVRVIFHACGQIESDYSEAGVVQDENRVEWLLSVIKGFRNKISHSELGITKEELIREAAELMRVLEKTLTVAGSMYGQNPTLVQEEVDRMIDSIKNIRDQTLIPADLSQYEVLLFYEKLKKVLKKEGAQELKTRYRHSSQLNPVSFLEGKRVMLTLNAVFTQIEVESAGEKVRGTIVPCDDIIIFCQTCEGRDGFFPEIYMIEGPAGSGKTTLMKHIKSQWSNPNCSMTGLTDFDLLLFMECRNRSVSSFSQLLENLLPHTSCKYFKSGELQKFVLNLKTLLVVDGLDELNSSSEKLFKEVIDLKSDNLVVICTSRPEKLIYFQMHVTDEFHTAHLKIIGIADNKREEFIRKYHNEMLKLGLSMQDTEKLLKYMRKCLPRLQRHFRLPLNLVVLVWLWADDPSRMNEITTSSELYLETLKLMKKKLVERLIHNETTQSTDVDALNEKLSAIVTSMCREALVSLRWDMIEKFRPDSVCQMKATCQGKHLPTEEVLSAFLVIRFVEGEEQVSVPHKLLHEFYASLWVRQTLFDEEKADNSKLQELASFLEKQGMSSTMQQNILSDAIKRMKQASSSPQKPGAIREILTELHIDDPTSLKLTKYQSLLVQVAGVLYAQSHHKVEECTAQEIVQLLKEARFGHKDNNEWFDLLDNVKNDSIILKNVSGHMNKNMTIEEINFEAALALLDDARPQEIKVDLDGPLENLPNLQLLLEKIANCNCSLDLYFHNDFKHPSTTLANDEYLQFIATRCVFGEFLGHISGESLAKLPLSCMVLNLALSSDQHAESLLSHLHREAEQHNWVCLALHLRVGLSPGSLCQLPELPMLWLLLSGVDEASISWVWQVAATMLPPDTMFVDIRFPDAQMSAEGWKEILRKLSEAEVSVGHLTVSEELTTLSDQEFVTIKDLAHSLLRCDFRRYNEDQMWESVQLCH